MAELATVLGEEKRRTGKHMRLEDGRKPRSDRGQPAPEKRRSPEHYQRMQDAMRRVKRTERIVRLMNNTAPLTRAQLAEIQRALEGIAVLENSGNAPQVSGSGPVAGAA